MNFQNILICYSSFKDKNLNVTMKLIENINSILIDKSKPYKVDIICAEDRGSINKSDNFYDLAFSVGGDGTFLRTVHILKGNDTPIIGINLGRRGFMTEIEQDKIVDSLVNLKEGKFIKKSYPFLYGNVNNGEDFDIAVNDIFISKFSPLKTVGLALYVDNQFVDSYICDGILVSSAFGSTAYNRALNGSIVNPDCPVFIITPVGTADSNFKSLIVPNTSSVRVKVVNTHNESVLVGYDGTQTVLELKENDIIDIYNNSNNFSILYLESFSYYDNVRSKIKNY